MTGLLIGLVAGLIAAGPLGYFLGTETSGGAANPGPKTSTAGPAPAASLPPYEAGQLALNKTKVDGDLAAFAQAWLPWIGGCTTNADTDGPKLGPGEQKHVFCRYGGVAIHFAVFTSLAERDQARAYRQRLGLEANELAPGLSPPAQKTGTASRVAGTYVEYAFKTSDGRILSGLWWDREQSPVGMYLEALWEEGLGHNWDPLRDLWQRYG